jgi:hypothetical protein
MFGVEMKICPVCDEEIASWETLCATCWVEVQEMKKRKKTDEEVAEKLRCKARLYLKELLVEHCRVCKAASKDFDEDSCVRCKYAEKERLIFAFLE